MAIWPPWTPLYGKPSSSFLSRQNPASQYRQPLGRLSDICDALPVIVQRCSAPSAWFRAVWKKPRLSPNGAQGHVACDVTAALPRYSKCPPNPPTFDQPQNKAHTARDGISRRTSRTTQFQSENSMSRNQKLLAELRRENTAAGPIAYEEIKKEASQKKLF